MIKTHGTLIFLSLLRCIECEAAQFVPWLQLPNSHTLSVADINGDGWDDLILGRQIYANEKGLLQYVGEIPSVGQGRGGTTTSWADFDHDGIRDVLVFSAEDHSSNVVDRIYKVSWANGKPSFPAFHDVFGFHLPRGSVYSAAQVLSTNQSSTWAVALTDLNADGYVDSFLGRGRLVEPVDIATPCWNRKTFKECWGQDIVVENRFSTGTWNNGAFMADKDAMVDISRQLGWTLENQMDPMWGTLRHARAALMGDLELDGTIDIFLTNYRGNPNAFLKGDRSSGVYKFSNPQEQESVQGDTGIDLNNTKSSNQQTNHGMAGIWADLDNDGDFDLIDARLHHYEGGLQQAIRLWLNVNGQFTLQRRAIPPDDLTGLPTEAGYATGHYTDISAGDVDNDGDVDLYLPRTIAGGSGLTSEMAFIEPKRMRGFGRLLINHFAETGTLVFKDETMSKGLHNPAHMDTSASALNDLDGDGRLDLISTQYIYLSNPSTQVFRNVGKVTGDWLRVRLSPPKTFQGYKINPDAIDTTVQIWNDTDLNGEPNEKPIFSRRLDASMRGSSWEGPRVLHFGLGNRTKLRKLRIRILWPGLDGRSKHNWQLVKPNCLNCTMVLP
jgi:hypothetical protein